MRPARPIKISGGLSRIILLNMDLLQSGKTTEEKNRNNNFHPLLKLLIFNKEKTSMSQHVYLEVWDGFVLNWIFFFL